METPQNIISKLERLNDKLASVDSEKYVDINPDNLASTAASLAQVSSYINKEFASVPVTDWYYGRYYKLKWLTALDSGKS
jgi:hypothetical protein